MPATVRRRSVHSRAGRRASRRWARSAADERALAEGCRFEEELGQVVCDFFRELLCHSKGQWAGEPFKLLDWQREELVMPLFGWVRPDGTRRYRRAYVEIPKKNGKSTLAAGIGLYLLVGDAEPGCEIYSAAADREQASIVHGEAVRMVEASPDLSGLLSINKTTKNIAFGAQNSFYRALSSEAAGKEGLNAHGVIIDELHVWPDRKLWDALKYAGRARRQPLTFAITTAGDDLQSVCREQHDYAAGVLNGSIEDTRFFAYIRAAAPEDDWTQPSTWHKANPSLGCTIRLDDFAADVEEAKKSPAAQSAFKRYGLNVWATGVSPWLKMDNWQRCAEQFTEAELAGRPCCGGLDLSKTQDMTACVLVFPPETEEGSYRILPYFWLPEDLVQDPDSPEEYRVWARSGVLELTPGNVCDYAFVRRRIADLAARFDLRELAYDPWNAEQLTQELEEQHGIRRIIFGQTVQNFAGPTAEFERLVVARKLRHNGHPILTWQAGHVQVRHDANGNKRPVKPPQGDRRKVDGIVAAIMGLARVLVQPQGSVYQQRGLLIL